MAGRRTAVQSTLLALILATYSAIVLFAAGRHEGWFDEAQAWLLARDLGVWDLIWRYARYEGTPPLWSLLLMPLAKGGFPYADLSYFSASLAIAGIAVFLWCAPFPIWLRAFFPFCYFPLFQFAIVARSYVLFAPLMFIIAALYQRRVDRPLTYLIPVFLLALASAHGSLLAAVLLLEWAFSAHATASWKKLAVAAGFIVLYGFLAIELAVPNDLLDRLRADLVPSHMLLRAAKQLSEAFWGGAGSFGYEGASTLFGIAVVGASLFWMRFSRASPLFLGMSSALLLLALRQAARWHAGILFLAWVFCAWIFHCERPSPLLPMKRLWTLMTLVFAVQVFFGIGSIWWDSEHVYSGSKLAAQYLANTGGTSDRLFAIGFKAFALQPYFAANLFARQEGGRAYAFYSWTNALDHENIDDLDRQRPTRVVVGMSNNSDYARLQNVEKRGYCLERQFDGALWWKNTQMEADSYAILKPCIAKSLE